MAEISNTTLAILVFATLIGVVTSTVVLMNRETVHYSVTGFAPVDTGYVNLTIADSLHIQVDPTNETIDFGTCAPRSAQTYWCSSNDSTICTGASNDLGNCTGDVASPQFLRILNVGNVNASVNVSSSCDADDLIGGTSPLFQYVTTSCDGANIGTWTSFVTTAAGTMACNLTQVSGDFLMYANVTIPNDAASSCPGNSATITFTAISV